MNKAKIISVFIITGLAIGLILVLQFKSGVPKESAYPLDQLEIQKTLLQGYVTDQQELETKLQELRVSLAETTEKFEQGGSRQLKQRLDELRELTSTSEIQGEGLEIFLADSTKVDRETVNPEDEALVHAADLRDLVNLLFAGGSEAVAINDRRILPLSSLNVVGNTFFIHDFYGFPPFTITAIGPRNVLFSRLRDETFLPDIHKRSQNRKIRFTFQEKDDLSIPAFSGVLRAKFLTPTAE